LAPKSKDVPLYFAFPDGVYDYVCAECTALCCKGHGFGGNVERELRPLFRRYPQLETLALERTGDQMILMTSAAGCVMLDPDNRCRIEKELGKDKKPNICNLFPFNAFARIGKTVTVSPHFLCPLRLVLPVGSKPVQGMHNEIAETIRQSQILDPVYLKARVRRLPMHASFDESQTLQIESEFQQKCASAFGKYSFQHVLAEASSDPTALARFVERARRILGLNMTETASRDHLDDLLLAFAPVYRLSLLSLGPDAMLRALAIVELITRRGWSTAAQLTLQTVANTASQFTATEVLLAQGDKTFDFGKVSQKTFSFQGPEITFAAFQVTRLAPTSGVLTALEQAIEPSMTISDRSVLLLHLGRLMEQAKLRKKRKHAATIEKILSEGDVNARAAMSD
jgi:Fe-S-cluster containining protein